VVDFAVAGFVGTDSEDHLAHGGICVQLLVLDGLFGAGSVCEDGALVDLVEHYGLRVHCLLLELAHEAVADLR